jgi:hypothetical protein
MAYIYTYIYVHTYICTYMLVFGTNRNYLPIVPDLLKMAMEINLANVISITYLHMYMGRYLLFYQLYYFLEKK